MMITSLLILITEQNRLLSTGEKMIVSNYMNLDKIRPKNETEILIFSINKDYERLKKTYS